MSRLDSICELANMEPECSRVELDVRSGLLARAHPGWDRAHGLPHPVFLSRAAYTLLPVGDLLAAAGAAYWSARPGWRDIVGFECMSPSRRGTAARPMGCVIRTGDDPIEGPHHIVELGYEEDPR